MRRLLIEFRTVRSLKAREGSRRLDHRALHSKADAEVRDISFPRVFYGGDLAFHTAYTEPAGDEDPVHAFKHLSGAFALDVLRIYPADVHFCFVRYASLSSMYLPTRAMVTFFDGCFILLTISSQALRLLFGAFNSSARKHIRAS